MLLGALGSFYLWFMYQNTSAVLPYNGKAMSLPDTGLAVPILIDVIVLTIGLVFMFFAKEPNLK